MSFPPAGPPALTVYVNAALGDTTDSWGRARVLATRLGGLAAWDRTLSQVRGRMTPVGMAVTLSAGRPPGGKVYLYAYGLDYDYCGRMLTTASGDRAGARCMTATSRR